MVAVVVAVAVAVAVAVGAVVGVVGGVGVVVVVAVGGGVGVAVVVAVAVVVGVAVGDPTMTGGPLILGVDPGSTGALAFLDADTGDLIWIEDMPVHDGIVSAPLAADIIGDRNITVAWVENVHSMPKQGVASSFKFGRALGTIVGVLGGARVPVEFVAPHAWKRDARLPRDKSAARRRAIELWPSSSHLFARVRDDGRAEAALIARHGWLTRSPDGGEAP